MTVSEKIAHLKGVMEGMEYDTTTKEGKLLSLIVDALGDIAQELGKVGEDVETLFEFADEIDEDLGEVESELFGEDTDEDEYDEDDEDEEMPECCVGCNDDCSTCGQDKE